jgi:hypothetical protein
LLDDPDAASIEQTVHRCVEGAAPADFGEDRRRHTDDSALLASDLEDCPRTFGESASLSRSGQAKSG